MAYLHTSHVQSALTISLHNYVLKMHFQISTYVYKRIYRNKTFLFLAYVCMYVCNSYSTARSAVRDLQLRTRGRAAPEGEEL